MVALPSMQLPQCIARAQLAGPEQAAVGDYIEALGARADDGVVVPCDAPAHFFRVFGMIEEKDAGMKLQYRKAPEGCMRTNGLRTMSTDPTFVRGYVFQYVGDTMATGTIPTEELPVIQLRTYRNVTNQWPAQWAAAHPLESTIKLAISSSTEEVVGGANGVHYRVDGLYASEVYVVTHGSYVHVFSAVFIDEHSPQPKDLQAMLQSVIFFPEEGQCFG